jgi:hypothetical protein
VLLKCAHPVCFAQFRYLHQGKIFRVQTPRPAKQAKELFEYFWLCDACSKKFKVAFTEGTVTTVPLYLQLTTGESDRNRKAA